MTTADEERKRRRLEAWRKRQEAQKAQQAPVKVSLTIGKKKKKQQPQQPLTNPFALDDDDEENSTEEVSTKKRRLGLLEDLSDEPPKPKKAKRSESSSSRDILDQFMDKLDAGATDTITTDTLEINVSSSMMTTKRSKASKSDATTRKTEESVYSPRDWMSDAPSETEDDEKEEESRRALIEALKSAPVPAPTVPAAVEDEEPHRPAQTSAEVKSEKTRREERLRQLEQEAARVRAISKPEIGWLDNTDDSVMEEAERNLQAAKAAPDALTVLAELNKKKELKVDHSTIDYMPFTRNLYRVPRSMANFTNDDVVNRRAKLKIRVRGHGSPAPVSEFAECGLSEQIIQILESQKITKPFPVQAQCVPCIMGNCFENVVYGSLLTRCSAGRDVIGIAKTGSGKTLAYLLPMLRHILVQPPLASNESGPIGLILAPARELAYQIHLVCKTFAKQLGLK